MAMTAPAPENSTGILRLVADVREELARSESLPPGPTSFSLRRTHALLTDPLPVLLGLYERHGPVFTVRALHRPVVFLLGPECNHYVAVSHADHFSWREGDFGELIPLIGDALLTTDGGFHDRARRIMLPAFHRRRLDAHAEVMAEEIARGLDQWRAGQTVDVYGWIRETSLRIAMRALLGLDPDKGGAAHEAAVQWERGLSYFATEAWARLLRGPGSPWSRMRAARRVLDRIVMEEIALRRRRPESERDDVLAMLIEARDEDGSGLTDGEIRDQLLTLMFAGHDTSSSTLALMLHELGRHPGIRRRVADEAAAALGGAPPTAEVLLSGLPQLDLVLDETLRRYPPAWIGPRRAAADVELHGHRIPAGSYVAYCSWASHHLPDVWQDPFAFVPERFAPEARRELPRGAYVPFGGGSRICIGKRFGQLIVKSAAAAILQRWELEPLPGHELELHLMPTIGPKGGLPMVLRAA